MALPSVQFVRSVKKSLRSVNCMSLSTLKIYFGFAGRVLEL